MIYIAGSYNTRVDLIRHKITLMRHGYPVSSSWLEGHFESCHKDLAAHVDKCEVRDCQILILDLFYNTDYTPGKMAEFGMALSFGHEVIAIGNEMAHTGIFFRSVDVWVPSWDLKSVANALRSLHMENYGRGSGAHDIHD